MTEEKRGKIKTATGIMKIATELIRRAFNVPTPTYKMTKAQVVNLVGEKLGIVPMVFDEVYHVLPFTDWVDILNSWWDGNNVNCKYTADVRDCDNFAFSFASTCSKMFGINTAGVVGGGNFYWHDSTKPNGIAIGRHAFTSIIALDETGKPDLYIFEPMQNVFAKATGRETIIKNNPMTSDGWSKYRPDSLLLF